MHLYIYEYIHICRHTRTAGPQVLWYAILAWSLCQPGEGWGCREPPLYGTTLYCVWQTLTDLPTLGVSLHIVCVVRVWCKRAVELVGIGWVFRDVSVSGRSKCTLWILYSLLIVRTNGKFISYFQRLVLTAHALSMTLVLIGSYYFFSQNFCHWAPVEFCSTEPWSCTSPSLQQTAPGAKTTLHTSPAPSTSPGAALTACTTAPPLMDLYPAGRPHAGTG